MVARLTVGIGCLLFLGSVALATKDYAMLAIAVGPVVVMEYFIRRV